MVNQEKKPIFKKWWHWVIIIVVLVIIGVSIIGCNNEEPSDAASGNAVEADADKENTEDAATEAPTEAPTEEPETDFTKIAAGMYKIGTDMPAGEYKLFTDGKGTAYFEISKDSSGEATSIIANDNYFNFTYVTLQDGQYFEFSDAYAVPIVEAMAYKLVEGRYIPGFYKIGFDIPAGEYKLIFDTNQLYGYYARLTDSNHILDSMIINDNFDEDKNITVNDGEYLHITGSYIEN